MSRENVEVVRQLYARWTEGDFDNREPFDEDLDFEMSGWTMLRSEPIKARGVDGMARVWREMLQGWDHFRTGPIEELIQVGDQIVVLNSLVARGERTGIEVNAPRGAVFTFREGKISRLFLADRDEVLEAVGLT